MWLGLTVLSILSPTSLKLNIGTEAGTETGVETCSDMTGTDVSCWDAETSV